MFIKLAMEGRADFSECGRYRYSLSRLWDSTKGAVLFVMLNPSTADAEVLDPTVRRCLGYAVDWGFGELLVANLFALRSTDPKALYEADDPIGAENDQYIAEMNERADLTVIAWGNYGALLKRSDAVLQVLEDPCYLKMNKSGHPSHPLYLSKDLKPVLYHT